MDFQYPSYGSLSKLVALVQNSGILQTRMNNIHMKMNSNFFQIQ